MEQEQKEEQTETKTEQTETEKNWLDEEVEQLSNEKHGDFEELPSLKLVENEITEVGIDISKPFQRWEGENNNKPVVKKIIPLLCNDVRMNWWLNVKNPVYAGIVNGCKAGQTKYKILQTGNQQSTKYVIVK